MLYCPDCQVITEGDCPHCRKKARKLREVKPNDPVLIFTCDYMHTSMVEPLFADNQIPYSKIGSLGSAISTYVGGALLEKFRIFVPYGVYGRAARLIANTFGDDEVIMGDLNKLGVDFDTEDETGENDAARVSSQYATPDRLLVRRALHERFTIAEIPYSDWVLDELDLKEGMRILDIGCGSGDIWAYRALPDDLNIVMADASEGMLEAAKEKTAGIKNVAFEFALADACDLPFEDGQFDLVLAAHMLYHVSDLRAALSEIARVLKHDGRLCATTVSTQNLRELYKLCDQCGVVLPFPANGFTRDNGKPLLRDYFEKVELRDHESMLQVTEAEPLVAYVQSNDTFGKQSAEGIEQLRKEVEEKIAQEGSFDITKLSCMFICFDPIIPEMESETEE